MSLSNFQVMFPLNVTAPSQIVRARSEETTEATCPKGPGQVLPGSSEKWC